MINRRKQIVEMIRAQGEVTFLELKNRFNDVSEMTLRNDLRVLDEERQIIRVHGGAKSVEMVIQPDDIFSRRSTRNIEKKECIARKAMPLLKDGMSIFLDSGTTLFKVSKAIPDGQYMIFTTGLPSALELTRLKKASIFTPGGQVNPSTLSYSGMQCLNSLRNLNFSAAFIGASGFTLEDGFSCGTDEECWIKKAVMERSEKKIFLLDSSKIGVRSVFTFAAAADADIVISDDELDEKTRNAFIETGIKVI